MRTPSSLQTVRSPPVVDLPEIARAVTRVGLGVPHLHQPAKPLHGPRGQRNERGPLGRSRPPTQPAHGCKQHAGLKVRPNSSWPPRPRQWLLHSEGGRSQAVRAEVPAQLTRIVAHAERGVCARYAGLEPEHGARRQLRRRPTTQAHTTKDQTASPCLATR